MGKRIRIGINGYGNLGAGVRKALTQSPDMELAAIFTRRDPGSFKADGGIIKHISAMCGYVGKIDVMILCGGSASDLGTQGPEAASLFNTVDSYDTHAKIPEYFDKMDGTARKAGKLCIISAGWDPGLFSLNRLLSSSVLPCGRDYTFWGEGVSQGHSDAIRRVAGVKNGIQYTVPVKEALEKVRSGENPDLSTREKHKRVCYVVAEEGANLKVIEKSIKSMPNYFSDYDTVVNFISEEEFKAKHLKMPHGGFVIRTGITGGDVSQSVDNGSGKAAGTAKHRMEFSLTLESNPEFTASVLAAYARAAFRMATEGKTGAYTVFDIPFALLSPKSPSEQRRDLL